MTGGLHSNSRPQPSANSVSAAKATFDSGKMVGDMAGRVAGRVDHLDRLVAERESTEPSADGLVDAGDLRRFGFRPDDASA